MVKCTFCHSVYYGNERTCSFCGTALPIVDPVKTKNKKIKKIKTKNINTNSKTQIYSNTQVNKKVVGTASGKANKNLSGTIGGTIVSFLLFILTLSQIVINRFDDSETNTPEPTSIQIEEAYQEYLNESTYIEYDSNQFDEFNERFQLDNADVESTEYLIWYYLEDGYPTASYEILQLFLEQSVKDDGEAYIGLANIYKQYGIYGYAYYVLEKGYELTKLESVKNHQNQISLDQYFEDTTLGDILEMMFGKDLSLVTYADLASIKTLEIASNGNAVLYSTEIPLLKDGYIENYDAFREEMKTILLSSTLYDEMYLDIFIDLQILIDSSSGGVNLRTVPYINSLYFLGANIDYEIENFSAMPNLKGLSLNGSGVKALGNIETFDSLEFLSLNMTDVYDISKIATLPNLKALSFYYNDNITNLDDISSMPNLKKLKIEDMNIVELNIDPTVTNLESLTIEDTEIRNLDFISDCNNLTELVLLDNSEVSAMPDLSALTNLESLKVQTKQDNNYSTDFIIGLTNLKTLHIAGSLSSFYPISTLTNLEELYIDAFTYPNNMTELGDLHNLEKLTVVGNSDNYIFDTSYLASLKNLKYLDLYDCKYVKGDALFNLENLEYLALSNFSGNFEKIEELKNLQNLNITDIDIHDNVYIETNGFITNASYEGSKELSEFYDQLGQLTNLEVLEIGKNNIDSVEFARNLTNLKTLYVNDNNITDLEPLSGLENLTNLDTSNNPISNS